MPIHYVEGDLLDNEHSANAFALAANPEGVMNTQLAVQFRGRYPRLYETYRDACADDPPRFQLGDALLWQGSGVSVFKLGVYVNPYLTLADNDTIAQAFHEMRRLADEYSIERIAMPPVAGGIGNLNWNHARASLEAAFRDFAGELFVYMKQKAPERDLEAIQASIEENRGQQRNQRSDRGDHSSRSRRSSNRSSNRRSDRGESRSEGRSEGRREGRSEGRSEGPSEGRSEERGEQARSEQTRSESSGDSSNRRRRRSRRGRGRGNKSDQNEKQPTQTAQPAGDGSPGRSSDSGSKDSGGDQRRSRRNRRGRGRRSGGRPKNNNEGGNNSGGSSGGGGSGGQQSDG